ncbi:MAG: hypothetical protein JWQ87_2951, partial [Candidatus Sulfotelmatobacter sp.]|nr:hypothetical protein [Candidatus Sulfotelmatobacter sp.]
MPRICSVCKSPDKLPAEDAILRAIPLSRIAAQTKLSVDSLQRHKKNCMAKGIVRAAPFEAQQSVEAISLLSRVQSLIVEVREIANCAKKNKSWASAISALRELRSCLELLGRMSGELSQTPGPKVQIGIALNSGQQQRTETDDDDSGDLDLQIARHVMEATNGFDAAEIERLKALCSRVFIDSTPAQGVVLPHLTESKAS